VRLAWLKGQGHSRLLLCEECGDNELAVRRLDATILASRYTNRVRKCHESGREQGWEAMPFSPDGAGPMTDMPMAPPQAMIYRTT
jgi:hypothetical protein